MKNSQAVVINSDMDHFQVLADQVAKQDHDFYGSQSENQIENSKAFSFSATGKLAGNYEIQLIGHFNQENAVAAGLACLRLGASLEDIQKGIAKTRVPGRMEVLTQKNGAKVFIDYAHNGDSLKKLLSVVETHQTGTISLVLGSTGNKGESRRKDFGSLLEDHPEIQVFLTADDPNYEDPWLSLKRLVVLSRALSRKSQIANKPFSWLWRQPASLKMLLLSLEKEQTATKS